MFKVGDKVEYTGNNTGLVGKEFEITEYKPLFNQYIVKSLSFPYRHVQLNPTDLCKTSQPKFKIGTLVYLKSTSGFFADGGNNPNTEKEIGTVYRVVDDSIWVSWKSCNNSYSEEDLGIVGESFPTDSNVQTHFEDTEETGCNHEFVDVIGFTGKSMGRSCKFCDIKEEDLGRKFGEAADKEIGKGIDDSFINATKQEVEKEIKRIQQKAIDEYCQGYSDARKI